MAQILSWSFRAQRQLWEICDYIAEDDPDAAEDFAANVMELVEGLLEYPRIGRSVPEYARDDIRERICGRYRIIYRLLDEHEIEIAVISHSARRLPDAL